MKKIFLLAVMLLSLSLMSFTYLPDDEEEREKVRAAVMFSDLVSDDIKNSLDAAEIYPVNILSAEQLHSLTKLEDAVSEDREWHVIYGTTDVTVSREGGWRVTGAAETPAALPTAESCAAEGSDICVVYVPEYGARLVLSEEDGSLRAAALKGRPNFTGLLTGKVYPFEEAAAMLETMLPEGMGGFIDTSSLTESESSLVDSSYLSESDESTPAEGSGTKNFYPEIFVPLGCAAAGVILAVLFTRVSGKRK